LWEWDCLAIEVTMQQRIKKYTQPTKYDFVRYESPIGVGEVTK